MDEVTALELVKAQCASGTYPTLTDPECLTILQAELGYTVWLAAAVYDQGTVIQPHTRNGHFYKALVGGASGAAEPTWPLYSTPDDRPGLTQPYWDGTSFTGIWLGSQVADGTVLWEEAGPDRSSGYTISMVRAATYKAWLVKAGKASSDYDVQLDSADSYKRSQAYDRCIDQAKNYRPLGIC